MVTDVESVVGEAIHEVIQAEPTPFAGQRPGWRPRMRAERRGGHARLASAALGAGQASGDQQTYVRTRAGVLSRPLASPRGWLCRHCTSCPATGRWRTDSRSTRHWPVAVKRNNVRLLTVLLTACDLSTFADQRYLVASEPPRRCASSSNNHGDDVCFERRRAPRPSRCGGVSLLEWSTSFL